MFLVNSRLGLVTATPSGSPKITLTGHSFSRSYGAILPSSLTSVRSSALGFSPHLPVSVYGTDTSQLARGFSWQYGIKEFVRQNSAPHHLSEFMLSGFAWTTSCGLRPRNPIRGSPTLLRHPITQTLLRWYRNI